MSFCRPWWLPTFQRHIDCIYQLCSGIPWPSSALPTWSQSWCLSLSGTRCAASSTEPCCSGTSCPEKTAGGNRIVVWKFVQSARCNPSGLLQQQRWPCRRWSESGTHRSVGIGLCPGSCKAYHWGVFLDSSRIPHNRAVVLSNNSSHIRHATVAYLESVLVEYFVQFQAPGEMLPDQGAELSANVRCHILAKRRVEPCDLPWSVPPLPSHSALPFFEIFCFYVQRTRLPSARCRRGAWRRQRMPCHSICPWDGGWLMLVDFWWCWVGGSTARVCR